ncbi:unnamed protein product [Linum tenue]|uniref:Uncharacterized protein n=1 Tax=Linum tenue TaxID=586396 RepID=A0AAV0GMK5_9ROSI|nr:unnamed protein product [Linum tenue]
MITSTARGSTLITGFVSTNVSHQSYSRNSSEEDLRRVADIFSVFLFSSLSELQV